MNVRKTWWEAGVLALVTAAGFMALRDLANLTIYQERDMLRASMILNGHFITYGPESSGGGFLPGPFYYFLIALPLALKSNWTSVFYFLCSLSGIAIGLAWLTARRFFSLPAAMVLVLTLVATPIFLRAVLTFQNYMLLPLFLIGIIYCYFASFSGIEPPRRRYWIISAVLSACALQLHGTALFYWLAGLVLQAFAPALGLRRVEKRTFAAGCVCFLAIISPYYLSNWIWGPPAVFWQNREHAQILTLDAFLTATVHMSAAKMIPVALEHFYQMRVSLLSVPAFMCALFVLAIRMEGPRRALSRKRDQLQIIAAVLIGFSTIPATFALFSPGRQRYLVCLAVAGAFWLAAWTDKHVRFNRIRFYSLLGFIAFGVIARSLFSIGREVHLLRPEEIPWGWFAACALAYAMGALMIQKRRLHATAMIVLLFTGIYSLRTNLTDAYSPRQASVTVLEKILGRVVRETGWSWQQAKERMYLVGFKRQGTFAPVYRDVFTRETEAGAVRPVGVDGYILIQKTTVPDLASLPSVLARARLPQEMKKALANGHMEFVTFEHIPPLTVAGYRITKPLLYPRYVQNIGSSYLDMTDYTLTPPQVPSAARTSYQVADGHTRFVFNDCASLDRYCEIVYDVKLDRKSRQMQVRLSGNALAQAESKVSPSWGQLLRNPYVQVDCAGAGGEKTVLAGYIGQVSSAMNTVLLTPLTRDLAWPCPGSSEPEQIIAGWEGGLIARNRAPEPMNANEIVHRLPQPERHADYSGE